LANKAVIAYLVRPAEGGIKSHLLTLLSGLDRTRFEPIVICPPDTSLRREVEQAGCKAIPLDLVGELNPAKDLRAVVRLRRILRRVKPDILHIHSAKAGLVGRLAAASPRHPRIVLTMHSFVFDERVGWLKRVIVAWVERRLSRLTDRIIAVSRALRDELVSQMGLSPDKITVIPNGITFREIHKSGGSGLRVGTVSRLAPQKGVDNFIRAAALVRKKFPSAKFTIIGDGPFREALEALADELGVRDSVEFLGFQPDAPSIVAAFDVFALASTWETFGLTLVEALSQQVPVVAFRVGGIPEIIDGSTTGLLAEPGDVEDLAAKICRLLDDKELAARIARDGCEFVRSRFSSDRMVTETQNLYASLVSQADTQAPSRAGQERTCE